MQKALLKLTRPSLSHHNIIKAGQKLIMNVYEASRKNENLQALRASIYQKKRQSLHLESATNIRRGQIPYPTCILPNSDMAWPYFGSDGVWLAADSRGSCTHYYVETGRSRVSTQYDIMSMYPRKRVLPGLHLSEKWPKLYRYMLSLIHI